MDCNNYSYESYTTNTDGGRTMSRDYSKKLSFKQAVRKAALEYYHEFEFIHNWSPNVASVAKEIADLLDEDPNMSFEEAYESVMDY